MSTDLVSPSKTAGSESSHDSARQSLPVCQARPSRGQRGWLACGLFVAAGFLAMGIDVPLSRALAQGPTLQANRSMRVWLTDFLGSMEPFGKPPVIVAVSLAVYLCAGSRRRAAFRIAGSFLLASLAANVVKLCIARVRPRQFDFGGTVLDTFRGIFWGTTGGSANQSFPSAHTTVAVAFCLALSTVFPRGRWLFATLAALVALQRIECGAHYLSDTLFAASLAYAVHLAVFGNGPIGRSFGKLESTPLRD
jgi:membrane-associated phospholipid phosphatase